MFDDDASLSFVQDLTPPAGFAVTSQSPWPFTTYLSAVVSPVPTDPESGIAAVDYAIGTTPGGEDVAYALYVLARNGRASIVSRDRRRDGAWLL